MTTDYNPDDDIIGYAWLGEDRCVECTKKAYASGSLKYCGDDPNNPDAWEKDQHDLPTLLCDEDDNLIEEVTVMDAEEFGEEIVCGTCSATMWEPEEEEEDDA